MRKVRFLFRIVFILLLVMTLGLVLFGLTKVPYVEGEFTRQASWFMATVFYLPIIVYSIFSWKNLENWDISSRVHGYVAIILNVIILLIAIYMIVNPSGAMFTLFY